MASSTIESSEPETGTFVSVKISSNQTSRSGLRRSMIHSTTEARVPST